MCRCACQCLCGSNERRAETVQILVPSSRGSPGHANGARLHPGTPETRVLEVRGIEEFVRSTKYGLAQVPNPCHQRLIRGAVGAVGAHERRGSVWRCVQLPLLPIDRIVKAEMNEMKMGMMGGLSFGRWLIVVQCGSFPACSLQSLVSTFQVQSDCHWPIHETR